VVNLKELLVDDNLYLHSELRQLSGDEIIGSDFGLKDIMEKTNQVASLDSPVLLLGETGVGKDVIANAIHYSSPRRTGPFIKMNCGAIPDTLIDSELFGHEKGAFTGALSEKRGRFERADKGTILLDEIGELPPQAQVRLLRVLQDKEIERVGGTKTIQLDIRIIAATNRNLEEMVKAKQFREDLWFRVNVFPILIPPLRERKSDIPALLKHFIHLKVKELKLPTMPVPSTGAIEPLMHYDWPGNIRELQNVVERALILNPTGPLSFNHMSLPMLKKSKESHEIIPGTGSLDEMTSKHIRQMLTQTNGKIHGPDGAAELLGINASTLRNRMNKLGIEYRKRRGD
jgi:transcriptional regulator with GAF, ATPase, and Fis domain